MAIDYSILSKESIQASPREMCDLVWILKEVFKYLKSIGLDPDKKSDLIIAVGNTGCGKSTMLNSLVFGSDSLEIR